MDWATAATLILGAALGLGASWVQRFWTRSDAAEAAERTALVDARRRKEERAEVAANELLQLLDQMAAVLHGIYSYDDELPEEEIRDLTAKMRRQAVFLGDYEVRRRTESIARVFEDLDTLGEWNAGKPAGVAYTLHGIGRNALGHLLSEEPLDDDQALAKFVEILDEAEDLRQEAYASRQQWEKDERTENTKQ